MMMNPIYSLEPIYGMEPVYGVWKGNINVFSLHSSFERLELLCSLSAWQESESQHVQSGCLWDWTGG
jgi:hypothetical protein